MSVKPGHETTENTRTQEVFWLGVLAVVAEAVAQLAFSKTLGLDISNIFYAVAGTTAIYAAGRSALKIKKP